MSETTQVTRTPFDSESDDDVVLTDVTGGHPITVINAFSVPRGNDEVFLSRWKVGVGVMAQQPGFIHAQMFQALDEEAELNFVNVVQWASGEALAEARKNEDWRDAVKQTMADSQAMPRPMVYRRVLALDAGQEP